MMSIRSISACLLSWVALAAARDVSAAQHCLSSSVPDLLVITPLSPDYATAKEAFNLRFTPSPAIIVSPTSPKQVRSVVSCAARSGLSVSAKSGGHSYAAYGLVGDVVIDMMKLKSIIMHPDGRAHVQTGNTLGDLATGIFNQGGRALPHGSCPYIGTGGHTLYGGYGFFSRMAGLLMDKVVAAKVVLADGRMVTASNTSNTDLFWAIRGGGPSFGLVTEWTYDTLVAPPTMVHYDITPGIMPANEATTVFETFQSFVSAMPKELSMLAHFGSSRNNGTVFLGFSGMYYGSNTQFQSIVGPFIANLPSATTVKATSVDWIAGLEANGGSLNTSQPDGHDTFFAKSLVTTGPSSHEAVESFVNYLATAGATSNTSWFVLADRKPYGAKRWGGAISSVPADATAFAHRDAYLVYQLYASSSDHQPPYPAAGIKFMDNMVAALEPHPTGAYPNYIDPTLTKEKWEDLYFGSHVRRLQEIKDKVDPENVFMFPKGFRSTGGSDAHDDLGNRSN